MPLPPPEALLEFSSRGGPSATILEPAPILEIDLLNAEINVIDEKQARSIKSQLTTAKLPLAKDFSDVQLADQRDARA